MGAQVRGRLLVWATLMALLALTVALTFAPLGPFRLAASLLIAMAKASLVYWVFMDLRAADGVTRIAALGALVFLVILLVLSGLDVAVRSGALAIR
jgi:cytochrome c oxidase subunit 4